MAIMLKKPIKFECTHCKKIYLHQYQHKQNNNPCCPTCHRPGLLLGYVDAEDFIRYPIQWASSYVKHTLHKLSKIR